MQPDETLEFRDYWDDKSSESFPIHVKEAKAVVNALSAIQESVTDHRVDIFCDNLAVV